MEGKEKGRKEQKKEDIFNLKFRHKTFQFDFFLFSHDDDTHIIFLFSFLILIAILVPC